MTSEAAAWHATWLRERPQDYGADVLQRIRGGLLVRATEYLHSQQMRTLDPAGFRRGLQARRCRRRADGAAGRAAHRAHVRTRRTVQRRPAGDCQPTTIPCNLTGMPAISVPCGFADGLPVGLQIMGPAFGEPLVLRVAAAYEAACDWRRQRPALV